MSRTIVMDVLGFMVLLTVSITAAEQPAPGVNLYLPDVQNRPRDARPWADRADGLLDRHSWLEAALLAGGIEDAGEVTSELARFDRLAARLQQQIAPSAPTADRARCVLRFLHTAVLTGEYRVECNSLRDSLQSGNFNCLTATLLFVAFAERCDCPVRILSTPRHVFCRLRADSLDIEPTCPDWLRASTKWDTGTAATDPRPTTLAPEIPCEITPVQLVARVYYNRGVALLEHRQFSSGTACLQASLQLDVHHAAARANLVAGLNNWALAECDASHFDRAAELVAQGQRLDPHFAPLAANDVHVHRQWVTHLCEKGEFPQAIELLENAYRRRPDVVLFDLGRCTVSVAWSRSLIQTRRLREAASVVERGLASHPDSQDLYDLKQQLTRLGS